MDILCSGPGPHQPSSGILGQSDKNVTGMLCPLDAALLAAAATAPAPTPEQAALLASRILMTSLITAGTITAVDAPTLAPLFTPWQTGEAVAVGLIRSYNGVIYLCAQAHTTQADWTPDKVPALWGPYRPAGQASPWVQPTGASDAYAIGALVTFQGSTYKSLIAANTYSPTAYPAGWQKIS